MYLAVAAGGALGAMLRYAVVSAAGNRDWPWGVWLVNVIGSFCIGVLFAWLRSRPDMEPAVRQFLIVGLLGAFTTFSTFSLDAVLLLEQGRFVGAATYVLASVIVCIAMAWLGMALVRHLLT